MEVTVFNVSVYFKIAAMILAEPFLQTGISLMDRNCNLVMAFVRVVESTELTCVAITWPIHQLAYIAVKFPSMSVTPQQERCCMWEDTLIKEVKT